MFTFNVIDNKTGQYPDVANIVRNEEWAKDLIWCDIDGFSIGEGGDLVLIDDCGNTAWCPAGRFTIVPSGNTFSIPFSVGEKVFSKRYAVTLTITRIHTEITTDGVKIIGIHATRSNWDEIFFGEEEIGDDITKEI